MRTMCVLKDSLSHFKRLQMGILRSQKETGAKSFHDNTIGVILFLLGCTVVMQNLRNTALIFLEIFLIQYYLWRHQFSHLHNYTKFSWITEPIACKQAHLRIMRAGDEEQSDPAKRSLVKRWVARVHNNWISFFTLNF